MAVIGLTLNVVLTRIMRDYSWPEVQWAAFAVDLAFTGLLFVIALRSRKFWPMPAAAFQFLVTLMHVAKLVDHHVAQWAYMSGIVIWSYALAITLAVGIWNTWRAERHVAGAVFFGPADTRR